MLTTGVDLIPGMNGSNGNAVNSGNDLIVGVVSAGATATLQGIDMIDGGDGTDTIRIISDKIGAITELNVVSNVEIVEVRSASAGAASIDTTNRVGVTNLNITSATDTASFTATAATTTDVTVSGGATALIIDGGKNVVVNDATADKAITIGATTGAVGTITVTDTKQGTGTIDVDGGTNVTITATTDATAVVVGGKITVGANTEATGTVTVVQNLNHNGEGGDLAGGDIEVTGGTTVDITVNANSTAKTDDSDNDIVIGDISVTGDGNTKTVTVTQTASVTEVNTAEVAAIAEKDTVTFKAMAKGDTLTTGGSGDLVFTAAKALTAEQVAAAFANLVNGDTQSATGPTANGFFAGNFSLVWSSAAASGATVVFTANSAAETNVTWAHSVVANNPTVVPTAGKALVPDDTSTNTVAYGDVLVSDDATAAIETVTLNGFSNADLVDVNALKTLNLANSSGDVSLDTTSTALDLTVDNITGSISDDTPSIETLTITATGDDSDVDLDNFTALTDLTVNATANLDLSGSTFGALVNVDVNGAGAVDLGNISADTTLATFNAAGNTGGVTVTVEGDAATTAGLTAGYVLSEGDDTVTLVLGTGTAQDIKVSLGAGNDTLNLAANTASSAAVLDGGDGNADVIGMSAASAELLSADTAFEGKMTGFERLSIAAASSQEVVDLANLDDINYVTLADSAGTAQTATYTLQQGTAESDDVFTVTINGKAFTYTTDGTEANDKAVADALAALINADATLGVTAGVGTPADPSVVTLTAAVAGVPFTVAVSATNATGGSDDQSLNTAAGTANAHGITLNNLANNGTVVLTDTGTVDVNIKDADTGTADVLNIITTSGVSDDMGYLQADDVETININASETYTPTPAGELVANGDEQTLVLAADSATSVVVGGEGALDLTLFNSDLVELVDASTNKGGLTFTASLADLVVQGGTGADVLTANADDVKLYGNGGGDTLKVDGGLRVNLYGGDGADTFEINASTSLDAYTVINGVDSGDVIMLNGANKFSAAKIALSLGADETLLNYANQAIKTLAEGEMGWFQRGGNTYIVQDVTHVPSGAGGSTNADAFTAGEDMIVMIVGLVDLGTGASYNTSNILEIV